MTAIDSALVPSAGWLHGRRYDGTFIFGTMLIAILSGLAVVAEPRLFLPILFADLWLLGYHHVISTFTRLAFDKEGFRQHRFLVLGLPVLVLAGVIALAGGIGLWVLASVYLYWQWFHYTRQSWGIARAYERKHGEPIGDPWKLDQIAFYALPAWGILYRSYQDPDTFLFLEVAVIPVSAEIVALAGVFAVAMLGWWIWSRLTLWQRGALPVAHTIYMASHYIVFAVAYLLIEDITYGWLVVNIWHNSQYVLFVWLFNRNRYKQGVDAKARLLSWMSQDRNAVWYFVICIGLSTVIYASLQSVFALLPMVPIIVAYQTINFHHYIVDALIWTKKRNKALRQMAA